jgi:hypothetical protein
MTSSIDRFDEQKVRSLLRKSNAYSGCSSIIGLFGLVMAVPFAIMFLVSILCCMIGEMSTSVALIIGGLSAVCLVISAMTLWFSWTSFRVNRTQAVQSRTYITTIKKRKAAQHGSISLSVPSEGGELHMLSEVNAAHAEPKVALDFDSQDTLSAHTVLEAHNEPVKK